MAKSQTLMALMNGYLVGKLVKQVNGNLSFQYDETWLEQAGARPISLSLPLAQHVYSGERVYHFFDNLLPDNPQIRTRIQRLFQIPSNHPFDLLSYVGKDCVGAIQLCKAQSEYSDELQLEPVNEKTIANILKHCHYEPFGMSSENTEFRISIAGVQDKTALVKYNNQWYRPLGATPTTHIFKLPIGVIEHQQIDLKDSCENEWLCSRILSAFGLPVAKTSIEHFEDIKAIVITRFDRQWASNQQWLLRLPQEDMCQALGYSPNLKYEMDGGPGIVDIMRLLLNSDKALEDRENFFHSQLIFYLLAAIDGHAKNFSIFINARGTYHLTPFYDIISAHPLLDKKQLQAQKIKMAMALIGKNKHYRWDTLCRRHFSSTAKAANFSMERSAAIIEEVTAKVDNVISIVSKELPSDFPSYISEGIFNGMRRSQATLRL